MGDESREKELGMAVLADLAGLLRAGVKRAKVVTQRSAKRPMLVRGADRARLAVVVQALWACELCALWLRWALT